MELAGDDQRRQHPLEPEADRRQLKQLGRDNLAEHIIQQAQKTIAEVDLSKGAAYLDPNWGLQSFVTWSLDKFQIKLDSKELFDKDRAYLKKRLSDEVHKLYRDREIEFPVTLAMARYMADRQQGHMGPMQQRYDREGLYRWYLSRSSNRPSRRSKRRPACPTTAFRTRSSRRCSAATAMATVPPSPPPRRRPCCAARRRGIVPHAGPGPAPPAPGR